MPIATFINILTVLLGGTLGVLLKHRFPEPIKVITFQALGLVTIIMGIQMALKVENLLVMIFSLILGGILGELLSLEKRFEQAGNYMKRQVGAKDSRFVEGLTTSFLLFCVGSMTIVGALNEGLQGDRDLLYTKSVLDGFASIALGSVYGVGVIFSVLPMLVFQGGITVLASQLEGFFVPAIITEVSAVGGVLILGIGINLLEIKDIKINNLLPALFFVAPLSSIIKLFV